jgi:hypothetical protein
MKVGDLIHYSDGDRSLGASGIIVKTNILVAGLETVPPLVSILWADGNVGEAFEDELEIISESR